ncbi:MAG: hypothetical protein ACRCXZ_01785 [Patescibacteria group bacterium]
MSFALKAEVFSKDPNVTSSDVVKLRRPPNRFLIAVRGPQNNGYRHFKDAS